MNKVAKQYLASDIVEMENLSEVPPVGGELERPKEEGDGDEEEIKRDRDEDELLRRRMPILPLSASATENSDACKFLAKLELQVPAFLEAVEAKLPFVKSYYADHVCWRTVTMDDYQDLVAKLSGTSGSTLLIESVIGGRPVATFRLEQGIPCGGRLVTVLEIPAPKEGSPYKEGLEHVEFAIGQNSTSSTGQQSPINDARHQLALQEMMDDHPELDWSEKAMKKNVNPDISVKLDLPGIGICSVKFHLLPLAKVIEYELAHGKT